MPDLTPDELEVLRLASKGLTPSEIAERLAVDRTTVWRRQQRAVEKLGAKNVANAVAKAIRAGLLDGEA